MKPLKKFLRRIKGIGKLKSMFVTSEKQGFPIP
jgi:hypothetical protein